MEKKKFSSMEEMVNYHIENNMNLHYLEIEYVFNHMVYKKVGDKYFHPQYKKLCSSIKYLIKNLSGKPFYALIKLINNDFKFDVEYCLTDSLNFKSYGYSYSCKNPETSKYLIVLASKLETAEINAPLNEFKKSL